MKNFPEPANLVIPSTLRCRRDSPEGLSYNYTVQKVLTAAQMREVDRLTTERYGIPSILLMENAAHAVARVVTEKLGGSVKGKSILILCGKGNNGGDGLAIGRLLWTQEAYVSVELFGCGEEVSGDTRTNYEAFAALPSRNQGSPVDGVHLGEFSDQMMGSWTNTTGFHCHEFDVIVDAVFGSGINRPLDRKYSFLNDVKKLRDGANRSGPILISVDLPSGVNADSSQLPKIFFHPDITVSFTAPKPANVLAPAYWVNGELILANIGTSKKLIDEQPSRLLLAERSDAIAWMRGTEFKTESYKNKRGHTLLIAGSVDYSGAAILCGNAAMRSGVGLVTLACPAEAKAEIASRLLPDVILSTLGSENLDDLVGKADVIAVGCGLDANDESIEQIVRNVVENRTKPMVVDAGALWFFNPPNGLLQNPERELQFASPPKSEQNKGSKIADRNVRGPLILTPHEGEFLRLLGTDDKEAIKDRVAAVRDFAQSNNVVLVLKGERVLIGHPDGRVVVNPTGNSGLGKAGNGDTLTGILAGFVAQASAMQIDIFETVVAAVYIAGLAGDIAEKKYGKRVMTATDVRECLADAFAECEAANG